MNFTYRLFLNILIKKDNHSKYQFQHDNLINNKTSKNTSFYFFLTFKGNIYILLPEIAKKKILPVWLTLQKCYTNKHQKSFPKKKNVD